MPDGPRDAVVALSFSEGYTVQHSRGYNYGMRIAYSGTAIDPITEPVVTVDCIDITGNCPGSIGYPNDTAYPKQQTVYGDGSYIVDFLDPVAIDGDGIPCPDEIIVRNPELKGINIDDTTAALVPSLTGPSPTVPLDWLSSKTVISTWRTFHYADQTPASAWVAFAVQNNIKVIVGLTLAGDQGAAEIAAFSADYVAASPALKELYNANVIAIAVGNEQTDVAAMLAGIASVKANVLGGTLPINAKATTVLAINPSTDPGYWITNQFPPADAVFTANALALLPSCDVIAFNNYAGYGTLGSIPGSGLTPAEILERCLSWTSVPPSNLYSVLLNSFGSIRFAMSKSGLATKPFWCTETGWSSQAFEPEVPGWSSLSHEATYYENFLPFDMLTPFLPQNAVVAVFPPERIFYFSVRDVPVQYFGLYTTSASLVSKF